MRDVPFFGELYRRTTAPLLSPEVTRAEARFIAAALGLRPGVRALDLGCGEGRHLRALADSGAELVGVDLDLPALRSAGAAAGADLRALPLRTGAFAAAWCWYTTLFVFDEEGNRRALSEAARVLAPGGRFLFQTVNPARLAEAPEASFERRLPDGSTVREHSRYDPMAGVDEGVRTLELPDGEALRGRYRLRYYPLEELAGLFAAAGLRNLKAYGSVQGDDFCAESLDLIVLASRR